MPPKTERQTGIQTILMLKHLQMLLRKKKKKSREYSILRYLTMDLRMIPKKRMSKASNIFDSLVMIMTRGNVKFMKCT